MDFLEFLKHTLGVNQSKSKLDILLPELDFSVVLDGVVQVSRVDGIDKLVRAVTQDLKQHIAEYLQPKVYELERAVGRKVRERNARMVAELASSDKSYYALCNSCTEQLVAAVLKRRERNNKRAAQQAPQAAEA